MTKKEVVNTVRNYIVHRLKAKGLNVAELNQTMLVEHIEGGIEELETLYGMRLKEIEEELED